MADKGVAHMGIGRANGKNRAEVAAEMAISSPLLETTMDGARQVLINIAGGPEISLGDFYKTSEHIKKIVSQDAEIIIGTSVDDKLGDELVVTVIATGFSGRTPRMVQPHEIGSREYSMPERVSQHTRPFSPDAHAPAPFNQPKDAKAEPKTELEDIKNVTDNSDVLTLPVFLQNTNRNRNRRD
jgi:cell division GTPase FtsZ